MIKYFRLQFCHYVNLVRVLVCMYVMTQGDRIIIANSCSLVRSSPLTLSPSTFSLLKKQVIES